jgi:hypothetical protein
MTAPCQGSRRYATGYAALLVAIAYAVAFRHRCALRLQQLISIAAFRRDGGKSCDLAAGQARRAGLRTNPTRQAERVPYSERQGLSRHILALAGSGIPRPLTPAFRLVHTDIIIAKFCCTIVYD